MRTFLVAALSCLVVVPVNAFQLQQEKNHRLSASSSSLRGGEQQRLKSDRILPSSTILRLSSDEDVIHNLPTRRSILTSIAACPLLLGLERARAADVGTSDDSSSFASIAARANQISKDIDKDATREAQSKPKSDKCAYDFTLPVEGKQVPFAELIRQEFSDEVGGAKVKAIIVVNIKQDDPVARKTIPELISLATKYGRGSAGSLAVVACPTDQGYYEPDTSQLIRLKLASEYGYGINPSTSVTDKVNLLGTGSHPFWRWLQSTCRTPAGLGRIEGNFEKFLLDGRTGEPLRRYPRKYSPLNMVDDIEAVIQGKSLPPARANWQEEWRTAAVEAQRDTYRFEKGLNYFDQ